MPPAKYLNLFRKDVEGSSIGFLVIVGSARVILQDWGPRCFSIHRSKSAVAGVTRGGSKIGIAKTLRLYATIC